MLAKTLGMLTEKSELTHRKDYQNLSNMELVQLLAKEARELELLEHTGEVIDAEAVDLRAMNGRWNELAKIG